MRRSVVTSALSVPSFIEQCQHYLLYYQHCIAKRATPSACVFHSSANRGTVRIVIVNKVHLSFE